MALTFRNTKGSALTHTELDNNFREFYYSASRTDYSLTLHKSQSSGGSTEFPVNVGRGPRFSIQIKSGSTATGSNALVTGSSNFTYDFANDILFLTGSGNVSGNFTVGGTLTAQEFHTEIVSSSTIFESGSTRFGDSSDDFHRFTGSVDIKGNLNSTLAITGSDLKLPGWTSVSGSLINHNNRIGTLEGKTLVSSSAQIASDISGSLGANATLIRTLTAAGISGSSTTLSSSLAARITTAEGELGNSLISSSAQIAADISGSSTALSSSLAARVTVNEAVSSSLAARVTAAESELGNTLLSSSAQIASEISGSFTSTSSSLASRITAAESELGNTLISSSAQIASDISGSFTSTSSSLASRIDTNKSDITTNALNIGNINAKTLVSSSAQLAANISGSSTVLADTTPQLGGNLDLNTRTISGSGKIDINGNISGSLLNINGTGTSKFTSHLQAHCLGIGTSPSGTTGQINATKGVFSGEVTAVSGSFSGPVSGSRFKTTGQYSGSSLSVTGDMTGSALLVNGAINATGDITAFFSSDERLKDNVTPIGSAIDKINQIGGYEFDWNNSSEHSGHDVGVIAQEIEKVLPEVVVTRDNGYKAVRYEKIVALLIQAIKDQQSQIDDLKGRL